MTEVDESPKCSRMKYRNDSFEQQQQLTDSDDDAFVDYDSAAEKDCLGFLDATEFMAGQNQNRIAAGGPGGRPVRSSSSEDAIDNSKAQEELQEAVAYSGALVGETVLDSVDRQGQSSSTASLSIVPPSSLPCFRHARSDVSSDDDDDVVLESGMAVGLVAQGLNWVRSQRESRRRKYLQYQAEQQLRKIKAAQLAERNGHETSGSQGLFSNTIFQNLASSSGASGTGASDASLKRPSSHRSDSNNDANRNEQVQEEDAAAAVQAAVSQSGAGYTVEIDVPDTVDDEADASWIPEVRLEEEELSEETTTSPCLLNAELRQQVAQHVLPTGIAYAKWRRIYSLARDGDSFETCLRLIHDYNQSLVIVRTSRNEIFGGFADESWDQPQLAGPHFFGGPGACLFTVVDASVGKLKAYKWTGANRYIQLTDVHRKLFAFGGGGDEGSFGLCVESDFQRGSTGHCDTFGNEPLCQEENFQIVDVEIFGFLLGQF